MELLVGNRDATWKSAVPVMMACLGGTMLEEHHAQKGGQTSLSL